MGCDIHMYIEYKDKDVCFWENFGEKVYPGRWYNIFAKLCGVRMDADWDFEPVSKPKGFPIDAAEITINDNYMRVSDSPNRNECSRNNAEHYVEVGDSQYRDEKKQMVSNPDWHSHSWASTEELRSVLESPELNLKKRNACVWFATLDAMKSLEASGKDVRIVFWFDN